MSRHPSLSAAKERRLRQRLVRRSRNRARPRGDRSGGGQKPDLLDLGGLLRETVDGVCAVNAEGRIGLWNRSARRILGYSSRDVVGRLVCEVFVGSDGPLCYNGCHVSVGHRSAPIQRVHMATRTKAGEPIDLAVNALVVPGSHGEHLAIVHLFRDVRTSREIEGLERWRRRVGVPADGGTSPAVALTRRELDVLQLVTGGANTRAVAQLLRVSPATVRNHVQSIFGKLGVHSRLEAAAYAVRHRLLGPEGAPG